MKRLRSMLMMAGLLVSAQMVSAQTPSAASLEALIAVGIQPTSGTADPVCPAACCPLVGQRTWLGSLLQYSVTSWQRLGEVCGRGESTCPAVAAINALAAPSPAVCAKGCGVPAAAAACCSKGGDAAQAQKCCCAKACACCEACKTPKTAKNAEELPYPRQALPPMGFRVEACLPGMPGIVHGPNFLPAPPLPPTASWVPVPHAVQDLRIPREGHSMHAGSMPRIIAVPATAGTMVPHHIVRNATTAAHAPQTHHAHLVTPDLEAHSERMTHKGDMILLEGDVRLVSRKNGQPIRIEAHRVMLNVNDGTFVVESDVRPARPVHGFGTLRTSAVENPLHPGVTVIAVPMNGTLPTPTTHDRFLYRFEMPISR